ncbi:MAG: helix-turn-helix domain-containing protein [Spirillospora sp.]
MSSTGRELADALNVVPSTVSNRVNGKRTPHVDDVERIEKRIGTNGYLLRNLKWVRREISPEWSEWREALRTLRNAGRRRVSRKPPSSG